MRPTEKENQPKTIKLRQRETQNLKRKQYQVKGMSLTLFYDINAMIGALKDWSEWRLKLNNRQ